MNQPAVNEDRRDQSKPFSLLAEQLICLGSKRDQGCRVDTRDKIGQKISASSGGHNEIDKSIQYENGVSQRSGAREIGSRERLG